MRALAEKHDDMTLERLYASELTYVYSFLHRLGARPAEVEDLAHDVFVTAMKRWSTFDASRPVRPWLLGIAFRTFSDARRKFSSHREIGSDDVPEVATETLGGDVHVEQRERRELIEEALRSLEPERRAVFVMYELENVSVADISDVMGTPVPTTYSRLRLAREEFTASVRRIQLKRGES